MSDKQYSYDDLVSLCDSCQNKFEHIRLSLKKRGVFKKRDVAFTQTTTRCKNGNIITRNEEYVVKCSDHALQLRDKGGK